MVSQIIQILNILFEHDNLAFRMCDILWRVGRESLEGCPKIETVARESGFEAIFFD